MKKWKWGIINENDVINLYITSKFSLNKIANDLKISANRVKAILVRNSVSLEGDRDRDLSTFSSSRHRIALSFYCRGWDFIEKEFEEFSDFDKLKFLINRTGRNKRVEMVSKECFLNFIKKFYNCDSFNKLYNNWILSGKNKWFIPSLEHKIPVSRGGSNTLENLTFMTWFENKMKCDMTTEEWEILKEETKTTSKIFV